MAVGRVGGGGRQSIERWNCFKGNIGGTFERRGKVHMGVSERFDTVLNWTELKLMGKTILEKVSSFEEKSV